MLKTSPVEMVRENDNSSPSNASRAAGGITLAGCSLTILAAFLPVVGKAAFGVSLTTAGLEYADVALTILAITSATIAGVVLIRRPATPVLAGVLLVFALMQLGLAIWAGVSIVHSIGAVSADHVFFTAVGTGAYLGVLGSLVTLAAGALAWANRRHE